MAFRVRRGSPDPAETADRRSPAPQSGTVGRPRHNTRRPDSLYHLVLLAISSSVLAAAMLLSVRNQTQVVLPLVGLPLPELCMLRRTTGLPCPGCGMTRCFISLAHGDLAAAWAYNPAGLWLFAILAFQIPFRSVQLWRLHRGLAELTLGSLANVALIALALAMLSQWLLRLIVAYS